jgi:hypothetical protein
MIKRLGATRGCELTDVVAAGKMIESLVVGVGVGVVSAVATGLGVAVVVLVVEAIAFECYCAAVGAGAGGSRLTSWFAAGSKATDIVRP